jgi:hypothetical protein
MHRLAFDLCEGRSICVKVTASDKRSQSSSAKVTHAENIMSSAAGIIVAMYKGYRLRAGHTRMFVVVAAAADDDDGAIASDIDADGDASSRELIINRLVRRV